MIRCLLILLLLPVCLFGDDLTTKVEADNTHFDGEKITLDGHVHVFNESYDIRAKNAVLIRDEEKRSRLEFPWAELKNEVEATFYNKYYLECTQVNFDYLTQTLFFTGDINGVFFRDDKSKLYADKGRVDYEEKNGKFVITRITLSGNVEMHAINDKQKTEQYALADVVECYPEDESVILKADPGKRALFFDKLKDVTISAETVKAQRKNGKEIIEGLGDVRFTFKDDEIEKLKNQFELK